MKHVHNYVPCIATIVLLQCMHARNAQLNSMYCYHHALKMHANCGQQDVLLPPRVHNIYREESIQLSISSLNTLRQVVT